MQAEKEKFSTLDEHPIVCSMPHATQWFKTTGMSDLTDTIYKVYWSYYSI